MTNLTSMKDWILIVLIFTFAVSLAQGQSTYPPLGLHQNPSTAYAFVNCRLVTKPGNYFEKGVLIIRNGLVENAGKNIKTPPDAQIIDLKGAYVYPGLIDIYASYGVEEVPKPIQDRSKPPPYEGKNSGPNSWNDAVRPEEKVANSLDHSSDAAAKWRKMGFTTVHSVPRDGIFRGSGALVQLGNGPLASDLLQSTTHQCLSFSKGSSTQAYPSSLMGAIALIRQTFLDAQWYKEAIASQTSRPNTAPLECNLSLDVLSALGKDAMYIFECTDHQDIMRAARIAQEFDLQFIYKGGGDSYQRLNELRELNTPLVISLNFPKGFDVNSPSDAREVSLRQLMHWEQAPLNAGIVARNGIPFSLTTADLKFPGKEFWPALRKAVQYGLEEDQALAALTTTPAKMLGMENRLGTLEPGMLANFIIADGPLFGKGETVVYETWVSGKRFVQSPMPEAELSGTWEVTYGTQKADLLVGGKPSKPTAKIILTVDTLPVQIGLLGLDVALVFPESRVRQAGKIRFVGLVDKTLMSGTAVLADGQEVRWSAFRTGPYEEENSEEEGPDLGDIPQPNYPFGPYGFAILPEQQTIFIKGAMVWTNGSDGILENTDVLVERGKIARVGKGLQPPGNAQVVDGTGKHLTPGIIDEHSHIAISRGVNEGTHPVTAEVRVGDVIDATDIDIYRQVAGGVTTTQLLHGSSNPIGGQSAVIKLRWGMLSEQMKFENAPEFIKFALGENVKQSNRGDLYRSRYPQTRLGVEQLIKDALSAALDYRRTMEEKSEKSGIVLPVRKDLQMDALLEVLDSRRFVTCHSYVQSEITMLMRLAESFNFRINTFTHVLEGYKIADKLAAHGANCSTFSDWWAYKYEVIDAIPYNAALMASQGINVCINSDDPEMGRRLNQEAAKAVMYGGISEEEALKTVTLNPAKALQIEDRVGSVEAGKDADLVLWSDHPLSIFAHVERTYIDGRLIFEKNRDLQLREVIVKERSRLIKKMIQEGGKGKPPGDPGKDLYHCETIESDYQ